MYFGKSIFKSEVFKEKNSIESLEKGFIKNTLFAGMLGAAAAMPQASAQDALPDRKPAMVSPKLEQKAPKYNKDQILDAIKQVESSGGKNLNHAVIRNPNNLNYGTRSSSAYGIMPITGKDIISKNPKLKKQYGHLLNLKGKDFHKAYHKDPNLDRKLASHYYDHAAKHFGHDPAKIGMAWLNGINGTKKHLNAGKDVKEHWHVKKILNALKSNK